VFITRSCRAAHPPLPFHNPLFINFLPPCPNTLPARPWRNHLVVIRLDALIPRIIRIARFVLLFADRRDAASSALRNAASASEKAWSSAVNAWFACDDGPGVLADFTAGFQAVDAEARGVDAVLPDGDGVCAGEVVDGEDDTHDEIYNQ
jgi:hypothetical protein